MAHCLAEAGFKIDKTSWTGNLYKQLIACGFKPCSKPWKAGDIHLKPGKHVTMSISATQIAHASINEKGTATGGKTGDQTGKEICIRDYYEYSGGWDYHLRYAGTASAALKSVDEIAQEVLAGKWGNYPERKTKLEAAGYNYTTVQARVNALSKSANLKSVSEIAKEVIDGKWGNYPERKAKLEAAGYNYNTVQAEVNKQVKGG